MSNPRCKFHANRTEDISFGGNSLRGFKTLAFEDCLFLEGTGRKG
jgi:hypothetical protein